MALHLIICKAFKLELLLFYHVLLKVLVEFLPVLLPHHFFLLQLLFISDNSILEAYEEGQSVQMDTSL